MPTRRVLVSEFSAAAPLIDYKELFLLVQIMRRANSKGAPIAIPTYCQSTNHPTTLSDHIGPQQYILSLIYHLVTIWWPLRERMMTKWWSIGYHLLTNWRPLSDHSVTTWWPLGDHLVTTWSPIGDHLMTTGYHLGFTWVPIGYPVLAYRHDICQKI